MSIPGFNHPDDVIAWDSNPAPQRSKFVPLVRPTLSAPLNVVAVSPGVVGCWQHYDGQNTVPCITVERGCRMCLQKIRRRRYWYLAVMQLVTGKVGILCITEGAYNECPALQRRDVSIRGHYVKAWRTGKAINGPMHVQVGGQAANVQLPADLNVRLEMMRIWGIGKASDML